MENNNKENINNMMKAISGIAPVSIYMLVFFIIPLAVFFIYSFWSVSRWDIIRDWSFGNYYSVFSSMIFTELIFRTIGLCAVIASLSVVIVYPLAYTMVFRFRKYRDLILFLLAISLLSNYQVRIYAWKSILSSNGLINYIAMLAGLADEPTHYLLYSQCGVIIVLVNIYIPFATLPIYSSLLNIKRETIEAAADLGANPFNVFRKITLPLSMPGVIVSFLFILLVSSGDFVTPELVGGKTMMIGNAVSTQFGIVSNWPLGSAMVFSTIVIILSIFMTCIIFYKLLKKLR
jgi:spermidine/putrescine transport system permease protein